MTAKKPKMERTQKHHKAVLKAMKEVIAEETWKTAYGDGKLAEQIRAKGVYATNCIVYAVRLENGIPDAYARKMDHFAAQAKGKK